MGDVFRFHYLKESALKAYVERHDELALKLRYGPQFTTTDFTQMVKNRTDEIILDHFMFGGVDLKGRLQYAYITQGTRLTLNLSVNPLGIIGVNTKLTAEASGDKEAKRSVVLYRGPSSAVVVGSAFRVLRPVVLHSFVGQRLSFKGSLGVEVSVGWEASVGGEVKQEDPSEEEPSPPVEHHVEPEAGYLARKAEYETKLETFAVGFEAKAGVEAKGTFEYSAFYAEDPNPCDYARTTSDYENQARKTHLRKDLTHILREGSSKTMYKYLACDLINRNLALFGLSKKGLDELSESTSVNEKTALLDKSEEGLSLHGKILWHVTTLSLRKVFARLIRVLQDNRATTDAYTVEVLRDVRRVMEEMEYFLRPTEKEETKIGVVSYIVRNATLEAATRNPTFDSQVKLVVTEDGEVKTSSNDLQAFLREVESKWDLRPFHARVRSLIWSLYPYVSESDSEAFRIAKAMEPIVPSFKAKDHSDKSPGALFEVLSKAWTYYVQTGQTAQATSVAELITRIPRHEAPCSLRIISDAEGGEARAFAIAGGEAKVPGASIELTAKITAGIKGGSKTSTTRFQTSCLALKKDAPYDPPVRIYTTYDTSIRYSHLVFDKALQVEAKAAAFGKGKEWAPDSLNRQTEQPLGTAINRMRYRCAIAVWSPTDWLKWDRPEQLTPLHGSGVVFGESVVVGNLRAVYKRLTEKYPIASNIQYLVMLAKSLHISASTLMEFLLKTEVRNILEGHSIGAVEGSAAKVSVGESTSVILEASFHVPSALTDPISLECRERNVAGRRMVTLQDDMAASFFQAAKKAKRLLRIYPNALRLRYRRKDFEEKTKTILPLGFNLAGTSFGIKLESVEKAGSDAIVELASWYPTAAVDPTQKLADIYENAVPPAVLFAQ